MKKRQIKADVVGIVSLGVVFLTACGVVATTLIAFNKNKIQTETVYVPKVEYVEKSKLAELNKFLEGKNPSNILEAIDIVKKESGISDLEKYFSVAYPGSKYVYDETNKLFVVVNGNEIVDSQKGIDYSNIFNNKEKYWVFATSQNDLSSGYSSYLSSSTAWGDEITVSGSLVVGNANINKITYISRSENPKTVSITTNSVNTTLVISETIGDTINHYGSLGTLKTESMTNNAYHEYGNLIYADVSKGSVVAERGGFIRAAYVSSTSSYVRENGGTIYEAYAASKNCYLTSLIDDDTYGAKKELIFNTDLSDTENRNIATREIEKILCYEIDKERINQQISENDVAYIEKDGKILGFSNLKDAVESVEDNNESQIISIRNNVNLTEKLIIKNKNISFVSKADIVPVITGNIEIAHTSGNHKVSFENLGFKNTSNTLSNIVDSSITESSSKTNTLSFAGCEFNYAGVGGEAISTVSLCASNNVTSTQLIFNENKIENTNYAGYALSLRDIEGSNDHLNVGANIKTVKKHSITFNRFLGTSTKLIGSVVSGNYFDFTSNTVENIKNDVFNLVGSKDEVVSNSQMNVKISKNRILNASELFKVFDVDSYFNNSSFSIDISDSSEQNPNEFANVSKLCSVNLSSIAFKASLASKWASKVWNGINDTSLIFMLDKVRFNNDSAPVLGKIKLSNGEEIPTYTELENPEDEGRHGFSILDTDGNKFWYLCTVNEKLHLFLRNNSDDLYCALLDEGDISTLTVKHHSSEPDWLLDENLVNPETNSVYKYYDESSTTLGALNKMSTKIVLKNNMTFVNASVLKEGNVVTVTSTGSGQIDFAASDISGYNKVVITNGLSSYAESNTLYVKSENLIRNVCLNGNANVEVDKDLQTLNVFNNSKTISVNSDRSINESLSISSDTVGNLAVVNNGAINKLLLNTKFALTNNANITTISIGQDSCENCVDSSVTNNGNISHLLAMSRISLLNSETGLIDELKFDLLSEDKAEFACGSTITNNGLLCGNEGNIYLYTKCTLNNFGTIGVSGRATCESEAEECASKGGVIFVGKDGLSAAHDGTIIVNAGTIYEGASHGAEHVQKTFVFAGVLAEFGDVSPTITYVNAGEIKGSNLYINYDLKPVVNVLLNL